MSLSWSERQGHRKEIERRFGRVHRLPLVRRVHHRVAAATRNRDRLLDVGAGDHKLKAALERRGITVSYRALDPDPERPADYADLAEVDDTFDVVCCFEVIEHVSLETGEALLAGMFRVLRPGGHAFVSTPNTYNPVEFHRDATHVTAHPYDQLAGLMEAVGFEVTAIHRGYGDAGLKRFVRRRLFGWLYRLLGIDYARQVVVSARRPPTG